MTKSKTKVVEFVCNYGWNPKTLNYCPDDCPIKHDSNGGGYSKICSSHIVIGSKVKLTIRYPRRKK